MSKIKILETRNSESNNWVVKIVWGNRGKSFAIAASNCCDAISIFRASSHEGVDEIVEETVQHLCLR